MLINLEESVISDIVDGQIMLDEKSKKILGIDDNPSANFAIVVFLPFDIKGRYDVANISRAKHYNKLRKSARMPEYSQADKDYYKKLKNNHLIAKVVDGKLTIPKSLLAQDFKSATKVIIKDMGFYIYVKTMEI